MCKPPCWYCYDGCEREQIEYATSDFHASYEFTVPRERTKSQGHVVSLDFHRIRRIRNEITLRVVSSNIHITLMSYRTGLTKSRKLNMLTGTVDNIRKFSEKFPYLYVWQSKWYLLWMVRLSSLGLLACWVIRRCSVNFLFRRGCYLGWTCACVSVCCVAPVTFWERIEISNIIGSCCGQVYIRWQ